MSGGDLTGADIPPALCDSLVTKAKQPLVPMLVLAVFAGVFIAFGSIASLVVQANMGDVGAVSLLSGLAFSVGLILVMVVGAELFTGNTMMVLPTVRGQLSAGRLLGAWSLVWLGNLIGSVSVALLFSAAGGFADGVGDAAIAVEEAKIAKAAGATFSSAILANMLVCLAVWMASEASSIPSKILAITGPVTVFVAAGLEHSVANMSLIPLGWLAQTGGTFDPSGGAANLVFSTAGNVLGGSLVALGLAYGHRCLGKAQ